MLKGAREEKCTGVSSLGCTILLFHSPLEDYLGERCSTWYRRILPNGFLNLNSEALKSNWIPWNWSPNLPFSNRSLPRGGITKPFQPYILTQELLGWPSAYIPLALKEREGFNPLSYLASKVIILILTHPPVMLSKFLTCRITSCSQGTMRRHLNPSLPKWLLLGLWPHQPPHPKKSRSKAHQNFAGGPPRKVKNEEDGRFTKKGFFPLEKLNTKQHMNRVEYGGVW